MYQVCLYRTEDDTDLNLGTSFSAETNRRDEDADMYVLVISDTLTFFKQLLSTVTYSVNPNQGLLF